MNTTLKSTYPTISQVPSCAREFFVARNGQYEIEGIEEIETSRRDIAELKRQMVTDEYAIRARISAAVEIALRDMRAPTIRRCFKLLRDAISRILSEAPLGEDVRNPWSAEGWSITEQGRYFLRYGEDNAQKAANSVGVHIGSTKPAMNQAMA